MATIKIDNKTGKCLYCSEPLQKARGDFCCDRCRAAWHRGVRNALKSAHLLSPNGHRRPETPES